ncbi:hypothetical protein J3R74_004358 [Puniceicoccus vermicola]
MARASNVQGRLLLGSREESLSCECFAGSGFQITFEASGRGGFFEGGVEYEVEGGVGCGVLNSQVGQIKSVFLRKPSLIQI